MAGKPLVFDTESFIKKSKSKYGDKFDYSQAVYTKAKERLKLRCIEHDCWFEIKPDTHTRDKSIGGCPICRQENLGQYHRLSLEDFKQRASDLHNSRYTYDFVHYFENAHTHINIRCAVHGTFYQTVNNHLYNGFGCPNCAKSGFQSDKEGYFYILKVTDTVGKFGITGDVDHRLKQIKSDSCFDISLMHFYHFSIGSIARSIETDVIRSGIPVGVVSKADMKQGFSETFYLKDISTIFSIIDKYTPA